MSNLYIHKFYDEAFLNALSKEINDANGDHSRIEAYLDKHPVDLGPDFAAFEKLTTPGPDFDVRFAGGAYEIVSGVSGHSELFVNCVDRAIFGMCLSALREILSNHL